MSSLKNTISKKDYYDLLQIQQLYCYCTFKDMNRLNKIVLEFEDDFIFLMFGIEIFSECRSLELKTEIYRRFLTIDFHHFEDLKIISWCTTDLELNEFWLKYKENIHI